jgi:dihydrofolate synthase / folylpolyglutamate synthase
MLLWPHLPVLGRLLRMARSTPPGSRAISARFDELLDREVRGTGPRIVKVAGTNGKGSVCAMLEACLVRDGLAVGMFTSPHLISPAERFRVNGRDVTLPALEAHAAEIERAVLAHVAAHGEGAMPSFFEMLVLIAARLFRESAVDVAIYEAGIGGYHDATSLLRGDVAAITSVALDHRDRLGPTAEAIAADKAGIATEGSDLVLGVDIPEGARRAIQADAASRGVTLHAVEPWAIRAEASDLSPARVEIPVGGSAIEATLPLLGDHQIDNLGTVAELARLLHERGALRDLRSLAGIEAARWAGRMDLREPLFAGGPRVLFDVAHNEHGIRALAASLDRRVPRERRALLYGASADKEHTLCLPHVPRLAGTVHLVSGFHRAESTATLAVSLPAGTVAAEHAGVAEGLRALLGPAAAGEERPELVIVTGSLYLVGAAMAELAEARGEGTLVHEARGEDAAEARDEVRRAT